MRGKEIAAEWKDLIVGQDHAIEKITPYIVRALANLNAPGRPLGVFFLMGPTGTGKTRTAETLAEVLHKDERNLMRVDCGEFQAEHEIAKFIGAPPGYLGHRETQPIFTQSKINALQSEKANISIVLFDEIEKAHPGIWRAILGVLDKASLRLGDNQTVSFERTMIFMSSNVGAKEMSAVLSPSLGFSSYNDSDATDETTRRNIERIGLGAISRKFPPEFPNRIDEMITYYPLEHDTLRLITEMEIRKLQRHIVDRLGVRSFALECSEETIDFLTEAGTSKKYGARELKRALGRYILNPLADQFIDGEIAPGSTVICNPDSDRISWEIVEPFTVAMNEPQEQETTATAQECGELEPPKRKKAKR